MMHVYFISGLGADRRAFQHIHLSSQYIIHHLDWKTLAKGESMNAYARRLAEDIDTTQPFCLVGLSFGGMIATEMNTFLKPVKTVLLSSTYTKNELLTLVRWIGLLRLHKLVPTSWLKRSTTVAHWFFGTKTALEQKLLDQIMNDTDEAFLQWAINAILTWKNKAKPSSCLRIHGDKDRVLPCHTDADYIIKGGSHFMVFNRGKEVSAILERQLAE